MYFLTKNVVAFIGKHGIEPIGDLPAMYVDFNTPADGGKYFKGEDLPAFIGTEKIDLLFSSVPHTVVIDGDLKAFCPAKLDTYLPTAPTIDAADFKREYHFGLPWDAADRDTVIRSNINDMQIQIATGEYNKVHATLGNLNRYMHLTRYLVPRIR